VLTSASLPRRRPAVVDLEALRVRSQEALAAVAAAPVQHLPAALLEALQGSWGTPEELGPSAQVPPRLRLVAG
jgi:hypothetical protein